MPRRPFAALALTTILLVTLLATTLANPAATANPVRAAMAARAHAVEGLTGDDLTLKRLFPQRSVFGPSAGGMAFSHDGRWAAWLYRPNTERRHGNDLWLLDTESGDVTRLTSVSVLAPFQASTRKVAEDRVAKAKKRRGEAARSGPVGPATGPDPVTGEWSGSLTDGDDGETIDVEMSLQLMSDGSVEGTARTGIGAATITTGRFDAGSGELDCVLVEPETGGRFHLNGTITDDGLDGTLTIDDEERVLELTATRTAASRDDDGDDDDADDSGASTDEDGDEGGDGDGSDDDTETEDELSDEVGDDDADDRRAPRYGGVASFTWSPVADELLFTSGGDLYRMQIPDGSVARLTRTTSPEFGVQYLPDGSGYTYLRDQSIIRVSWDDHRIRQFDPDLPRGETLSQYRISPDGRKLAFITTRGTSWWGSGQQITIVDYRGRFARARQVPRHMPGDQIPDYQWGLYVYDAAGHDHERGELVEIARHRMTGPRDIVQVPEWSLDSSRACFMIFDQKDGMVRIMESRFPESATAGAAAAGGDGADADADAEPTAAKAERARVVYTFAHRHGPNTPTMIRPMYLADSRRMVFLTELSGFRHLHVLDPLYEELTQLTRGRFEVYPIAMNEAHDRMWVTSTREHPSRIDVYEVDLEEGGMERVSVGEGVHSGVAVSDDGRWVLANRIDFGELRELRLIDTEDGTERTMTDSHGDEARLVTAPMPEYFSFENRHGHTIHGHMFKPHDWSPEDQRPLLLYVYGGPLGTRNMISRGAFSAPSYYFAYYMARKHGWVTATIDPRGASGLGGLFEKANFEQVGRPQVEDLVDAANWLSDNAAVDRSRRAMHGWSFGGFQTQMTLYTEPNAFAAGIAGAGPTEWKNYNTWYTTGTVGEQWAKQGMPDGETYSLLPLAKNLKSRLLLVHGMEDSNVLYQDTVRVYQALLQAGKGPLVDLFLDPTGGHGLGGDVNTLGRYSKYEQWLLDVVGTGAAAEAADADADAEDADDAGDDD